MSSINTKHIYKILILILFQIQQYNCRKPSYYNDRQNMLKCDSLNFTQDLEKVQFYIYDLYFFFIFGTIGIFCTLYFIYLSIKHPQLRKLPGDIFLGLAITEFFLIFHWLYVAIRQISGSDPLDNTDKDCTANSIISIMTGTLEVFYNGAFYLFIISKFKSGLKNKQIKSWQIHTAAIIFSSFFVTMVFITKYNGKNQYGSCSFKTSPDIPLSALPIILCFNVLASVSLWYLKNRLPVSRQMKKLKNNYINFAKFYIILCQILWNIILLSNIMTYINCQYVQSKSWQFWITVGNLTKIIIPIALTGVRLLDPQVKRIVFKNQDDTLLISNTNFESNILEKISQFQKENQEQQQNNEQNNKQSDLFLSQILQPNKSSDTLSKQHTLKQNILDTSQSNTSQQLNPEMYRTISKSFDINDSSQTNQSVIITPKKKSEEMYNSQRYSISELKQDKQPKNRLSNFRIEDFSKFHLEDMDQNLTLLNMFSQNYKKNILNRILAGIQMAYKDINNIIKPDTYKQIKQYISIKNQFNPFREQRTYKMEHNLFEQVLRPETLKLIESDFYEQSQKQIMTSYFPSILQKIIDLDNNNTNSILRSLDLNLNIQQVKNSSNQGGGKSGEFFLFTHDNKIVLKTINKYEQKQFAYRIHKYYEYIRNNKTYIAKIYGIFEFINLDFKPVIIMMMKNIADCPNKCVFRKYDIKGSTYDRQVLKKDNKKNIDVNTAVLKDTDFYNLENNLAIEQFLSIPIVQTLKKDSQFLKNQGLMDYSLIVFKCKNGADYIHQEENLYCFKSQREPGIYYRFGIIDYLQEYNCGKIIEKYWKRLVNCNRNLDTSTQNAEYYMNRFQNCMYKIFSIENLTKSRSESNNSIITMSLSNSTILQQNNTNNSNNNTNNNQNDHINNIIKSNSVQNTENSMLNSQLLSNQEQQPQKITIQFKNHSNSINNLT